MTGKDMLLALSDIDEAYIMESAEGRMRRKWPRMLSAAAAVLLVVGLWAAGGIGCHSALNSHKTVL